MTDVIPPDDSPAVRVDLPQSAEAELMKADTSLRTIWGWASVISEHGQPVVDRRGDVISEVKVRKAAHALFRTSASARPCIRASRSPSWWSRWS